MENDKNPLSPHLQMYKWQISSLLSITHRIVGESNYENIKEFLNSYYGKFLIISLCWTFSFHILNEIRHITWDLGYGFDLKVAKVTGYLVLIGSFILTILFYLVGRNFI